MTVPVQNPHVAALANGATTVFPYNFLIFDAANLEVRVNNVVQAGGYSVSGVGNTAGGNVTFTTAPASGAVIDLTSAVPYSRTTDFQNLGDLLAGTLNRDQDDPVLMIQQLAYLQSRAITMPQGIFPAPVGTFPTPIPGSLLGWSQDGTQIVNLGASGVGAGSIVDNNVNTSGISAGKIFYTAPGGVQKFVSDLWSQGLTVENFGAVGNGTANDQAAFLLMQNTLGYIRLRKATYFIGNWTTPTYNAFIILGAGRAQPNGTSTGYIDGTGSIIVGRIFARATFGICRDFSVDVGDTRNALIPTEIDGLIVDAPSGGAGTYMFSDNIGSCGKIAATVTHGLLHEGFNAFTVNNIEVLQHNYGVVIKSRNGFVSNILGNGTKVAALYLRGSDPSQAGGVASGAVDNVVWENVIATSSTSSGTQPGFAVWVEASSANVTRVSGSGAHCTGGRGVYRASAVGAFLIAGISARDIRSTNSTLCWETLGTSFEVRVDGWYAENPSSGEGFETDTTSTNWSATNGTIVVTLAGISGTSVGLMRGTGSWDGLIVRNTNATMTINHSLTAIRGGRKQGTVKYLGEGTLALGGSIVAAAGEVVPAIMMKPDNTIVLTGVLNPSAGSSSLAGLTGAMNFGLNRYFTAVARNTSNAYTTCDLLCSGTTLTLLAPAANTLNQISLDGIIVHST